MGILDDDVVRPTQAVYVALVAAAFWLIGTLLYRLFFSPLSRLPGPWLTKISTIPEANALKEQRRARWVTELFEQNPGAVAIRTGPTSVSFNSPEAVKAIYGHGKTADGFGKSSWYDSFSTTGESLFSTRSKKRHAIKRRMVAHGFSAQSLQLFEPYVDGTIAKFLAKMDGLAEKGQPFDIYFWFELFTMDLMGELALGSSFGTIDAGQPARYSKLVEQSQRFANHSGLLPFGKYNVKVLSWVPLPRFQQLYKARLEYLDYARQALERRFQSDRKQNLTEKARQDIMQRFIEAKDPETGQQMDFNELRAETSSLMVAGASTGSTTLNWMIYYLCKNPSVKSQLIEQLQSVFPDDQTATESLAFTQLNKVPLLEHTEIECLRLHPPIGYAMPRNTPPQGAVICGVYIPGGVAVGVPAASIGRNADVYYDPNTWDPYRWSNNQGDLATMKTSFLGFGYGSRQCIGRNVATQFITKMIATLLLRYDIQLEDPELILGTREPTIQKPDKPYRVTLKRKNS